MLFAIQNKSFRLFRRPFRNYRYGYGTGRNNRHYSPYLSSPNIRRSSGNASRTTKRRRAVLPGQCPNILAIAQNNPYKLVRAEAMKIYQQDCT
ncbi:MAG: hypothetical protein QNJ49_01405 [Mastigocoleus sp. MO_167.B18]|uniref:hypothetical protein n=1 Tax=Mastigocoleus sp. MO_188.B34 TaxID=3036635 RepID=UPI002604D6A3|nr:hypothetical protein [Mastigocoleus sp. MO_188.B34]MDJ0772071.1 hypothetical protein [Mastigocoleus sp. MO_167.B18]